MFCSAFSPAMRMGVLLGSLLPAAAPLQAAPLAKTTHTYKTADGVAVAADVYRPEGNEPRPVAVWIHGGALIVGSRAQVPRDLLDLATQQQFVLVSLDYRLAPEVKLPEIASDLKDAFAWIREKGPTLFNADTRRIVVVGGSAGGFLTMLSGVIVQPKPTALVAYWGYGDLDGPWTMEQSKHHGEKIAEEQVAGAVGKKVLTNTDVQADQKARGMYYRYLRQNGRWGREVTALDAITQKEALAPYCPVRRITSDYPPLLMVHGTKDTDVPYSCSVDMAAELTKHGVKNELLTVTNGEHGLRDGDPARVREVRERALQFITEKLGLKSTGN